MIFLDFCLLVMYAIGRRLRLAECGVSHPTREEAMYMLLEQVYLLFMYILFIELAIVTVVAIALFVTLVVTMRKLDSKKNTSLPGRSRCILKNILFNDRHISVVSHLLYLLYSKNTKKSTIFSECRLLLTF